MAKREIPKWMDAPTEQERAVLKHIEAELNEYTRCVLMSMLHECRNPSQLGHTGPLTAEVLARWQRGERAVDSDRCRLAASALERLAEHPAFCGG